MKIFSSSLAGLVTLTACNSTEPKAESAANTDGKQLARGFSR